MRTPPEITDGELARALDRIAKRRDTMDDEGFGLIDQESPADVRRYLLAHPSKVRWMAQADAGDCQTLRVWEWWRQQDEDLAEFEHAQALGLSLAQLGSEWGLSKNGMQGRLNGLRALARYRRPDYRRLRADRQAARQIVEHAAECGEAEMAWLAANAEWCSWVAECLLGCWAFADEATLSDLVEVRRHLEEEDWTSGALMWMGYGAASLRACAAVRALHPRHRVHAAIRGVGILRGAFADLTKQDDES